MFILQSVKSRIKRREEIHSYGNERPAAVPRHKSQMQSTEGTFIVTCLDSVTPLADTIDRYGLCIELSVYTLCVFWVGSGSPVTEYLQHGAYKKTLFIRCTEEQLFAGPNLSPPHHHHPHISSHLGKLVCLKYMEAIVKHRQS